MITDIIIPEDELPIWMRKAMRGFDWGVVIVFVSCVLLGWQFILQSDLPRIHHHESYALRVADYQEAFLEGRLYPRWAPHAFGGYGAPIYNYYPPGAPYLSGLISVLFTNDVIAAMRIVYVLSFCLAGASIYALMLRQADAATGIISALLYVYSPFFGLTASQIIGDLNLVLAMALLPCLLWSWNRLTKINGEFDLLWVSLAIAGLILTHPMYALIGSLIIFMLSIWRTYRHKSYFLMVRVCAALVLGLGLSSFFWIPALFEYNLVQWQQNIENTVWQLQFPEILSPIKQIDTGAIQTIPQFTLGRLSILLTVISLIFGVWKKNLPLFIIFFSITGFIFIFLSVVIYPTEIGLLGIIALCFAIGGGYVSTLIRSIITRLRQRIITTVLILFILISARPIWLGGAIHTTINQVSPTSHIFFEQQGYGVAALPKGSDIPSTLPINTPSNVYLLAGYQGEGIDRLNPSQSAIRSQFSRLYTGSHQHEYLVRSRETVQLELLVASFAGWQATLDNTELAITNTPENHLLAVTVPQAEQGELTIRLGTTNIRLTSWIIAWCSVAIGTLFVIRRLRQSTEERFSPLNLLSKTDVRLIGFMYIGVLSMVVLLFFAESPISLREEANYQLQSIEQIRARTDIGLEFIGYEVNQTAFQPADSIPIHSFWQTNRPLLDNYSLQYSLQNITDGTSIASTTINIIGDYPTRGWLRNLYVEDFRTIAIPDEIESGDYLISVEVFNCTPDCLDENRLNFFDRNGRDIGLIYTIPQRITITE